MYRAKFLNNFKDNFEHNGGGFALCYVDGTAITFSALDSVSSSLKSYYAKIFKVHVTYVGVCVLNYKWLIPIFLGLWKSEHAIAAVDPKTPEHIIEVLALRYIISDCKRWDSHLISEFSILNSVFYVYEIHSEPENHLELEWDMCYALCTSGSTGRPKIVQVPWSCIYPNAEELAKLFLINKNDVFSCFAPYTFDPFFLGLFCCLMKGATFLFPTEHISNNSMRGADQNVNVTPFSCNIDHISLPQVTIIQITPSLYKFLEHNLENLYSRLRVCIIGGEKFPELKKRLAGCRYYNIYGITELSCWSFIYEVTAEDRRIPIGKPLEGILYKIEEGELLVGSQQRKCLVEGDDPGTLPVVIYRKTGDLVDIECNTGNLYFLSRKDDVVKKFGRKVSMNGIHKLLEGCDFLKNFCVVFDDATQSIGLFLVPNNFNSNKYERISFNQLLPLGLLFSRLDDLEKPDIIITMKTIPTTNHGKTDLITLMNILRKELRKRPFEKEEITFESLWREILGLPEVIPEKSFIESGGNSILALKLISRLTALNINYPEILLSKLLGSWSFQKCCSLVSDVDVHKKSSGEGLSTITQAGSSVDSTTSDESSSLKRHSLSILWSFNMKKCVDAPPQLFKLDGIWYVAVGSHSSQLSAVAVENGKELWTVYLGDRIESGIAVSPDQERLFTGCYDHHIYCLAARTGHIIWKYRTGGMVKTTPRLSPDAALVYCGSYDKQFYCLNAQSGVAVASTPLGGCLLSTAALNGRLILQGALDGSCTALEASSLVPVWQASLYSPIFSSPCLIDKGSRVIFAEVEGSLHCFNVFSAQKEWKLKCGGNIFSGLTALKEPHENLVSFGCHDRHLYLLQVSTEPTFVWKILLDSPIACAPAVRNDLIGCVTTKGILHLIHLDGHIDARLQLGGETFSTPTFFLDHIYLGCRNDCLICVKVN